MRDFADGRCEALSTGQRQKVSIARAVLHDPPVLILDEPTTGLDVLASSAMIEFIESRRAAGTCVLFSTHVLSEAERLCDRIGVLHDGRLLAVGHARRAARAHRARCGSRTSSASSCGRRAEPRGDAARPPAARSSRARRPAAREPVARRPAPARWRARSSWRSCETSCATGARCSRRSCCRCCSTRCCSSVSSLLEALRAETLEARSVRVAIDVSRAPEAQGLRLRTAAARSACRSRSRTSTPRPSWPSWEWSLGPERERRVARRRAGLPGARPTTPSCWPCRPTGPGRARCSRTSTARSDMGNEAQRRALDRALDAPRPSWPTSSAWPLLGYDPARGLTLSPIDVAMPQDRGGAQLGRCLPLLGDLRPPRAARRTRRSRPSRASARPGRSRRCSCSPCRRRRSSRPSSPPCSSSGVTTLVLNAGSVHRVAAPLGLGSAARIARGRLRARRDASTLGGSSRRSSSCRRRCSCARSCASCAGARGRSARDSTPAPAAPARDDPADPAGARVADVRARRAPGGGAALRARRSSLRDALRGSARRCRSRPGCSSPAPPGPRWRSCAWRRSLDTERLVQRRRERGRAGRCGTRSRAPRCAGGWWPCSASTSSAARCRRGTWCGAWRRRSGSSCRSCCALALARPRNGAARARRRSQSRRCDDCRRPRRASRAAHALGGDPRSRRPLALVARSALRLAEVRPAAALERRAGRRCRSRSPACRPGDRSSCSPSRPRSARSSSSAARCSRACAAISPRGA